jgi:branched-chain amino acid transport system permease protein
MSIDAVVAILVSGIVLGSLYALMAGGLSLVWSTMRVFNFTHGTMIMLGAYLAWTLTDLGAPLLLAAVGAIVGTAIAGIVFERLLIRPLIGRDNAVLMVTITTLAGAMFLVSAAQIIWGARVKQLPRLATGTIEISGTAIGMQDVIIIIVAPTVILLVTAFLRWTKVGSAIRAVEQNRDLAQLIGIKPGFAYTLTHALSGALAGLAGFLLGAIVTITPTMGADPLLKAFIVVVFGGLGSMPGTTVGAYVVGMITAVSQYVLGLYWTPVVLFLLLITVLAVRPTGLMGRAE